jgi:hypothetical protein
MQNGYRIGASSISSNARLGRLSGRAFYFFHGPPMECSAVCDVGEPVTEPTISRRMRSSLELGRQRHGLLVSPPSALIPLSAAAASYDTTKIQTCRIIWGLELVLRFEIHFYALPSTVSA